MNDCFQFNSIDFMDMLEGAKIIPHWENKSWQANEGTAPSKPSYFRRSLTYIFNHKEVRKVNRTNSMCMTSVYSNPNPVDKIIPFRRAMSLDYTNLEMTAYRSTF